MKIKLWHCKNVDLADVGGYWHKPTVPKRQTIEVADLKAASQALRYWVTSNGFGGGNMDKHCGEVHDGQNLVALVSFNGRVWTTEPKWEDRKEIAV